MMNFIVFDYEHGRINSVIGLLESIPFAAAGFKFKEEWTTLKPPFFTERPLLGLGYYRHNKTTGDWEPSLFFAKLDENLEVQHENKARTLDPRLAIK